MTTKIVERQYPLIVVARVGITATGSATVASTTTIKLPPNSMLVGGSYRVVAAATGTSPTLTMVDNLTSPNTLLSAVAIGVADVGGLLATAEASNFYPSGATLSFTTGGTSTPAAGDVLVAVAYVIVGRCNEVYGVDG